MTVQTTANTEHARVHTVCDLCSAQCPIVVHRVNGTVVKVEGDRSGPFGNARLCARGHACLMDLYDPNRLTRPMKRTNPQKGLPPQAEATAGEGLDVDPGWQEISWDEALDTIAERLKKIREDDPRKLLITASSTDSTGGEFLNRAWAPAFGTPNTTWQGYFCGNYLHVSIFMTNGAYHPDYDHEHCKYLINLGTQMGFGVGYNANINSQKMAEARMRGMKVVVVDPIMTNAAAKADEWVPIRPGTDGALMLGLMHVLLHELNLFDAEFLKKRTNGPYLVANDGFYVKKDQKPLVWDTSDNSAKPFDADVKDYALDGSYSVEGVECRPAFSLFKEAIREYTPEIVSRATTIPAENIRRIAREFGEAASIGATKVIGGREVPYRPVAISIYRGAGAHAHGIFTGLAVQVLQILVGSFYAVGGHRGVNLIGPNKSWLPRVSSEGMVVPPSPLGGPNYYDFDVNVPRSLGLNEMLPISTNRSAIVQHSVEDPQQFKLPYRPEMAMIFRHNQTMTSGSPERAAEMLRKIPFLVYFTTHVDEQCALADIILPEQHSLERLELQFNPGGMTVSAASDWFYWQLRQPVSQPAGESRFYQDVLIELAHRAGFSDDLHRFMNVGYNLREPYQLSPSEKYSLAEIYDRRAKSTFGRFIGLDWFKKNGSYKVKRTAEDIYPLELIKGRFPIYFENIQRAGREIEQVSGEMGFSWDTTDYKAILHWRPCPAFSEEPSDEFYVVNHRSPLHSLTYTAQNPWLNELGQYQGSTYKVLMNTQAAQRLGIANGDVVRLESESGSVTGAVRLTNGMHPEVLGIAGNFGSRASGKPIAKGTGVHFNSLVSVDVKHTDPVAGGLDSCVRVKVTRLPSDSK
ncbi:MAG: molybdopterin-dependent oxidoreductase [Chloroflexi bacterium]|nr:molybdopterin-dependent oxidoreductase [Chloroflexota bacterium]